MSTRQDDPRFTSGLLLDAIALLERHGYRRAANPASLSDTMLQLLWLTEAFEGKRSPEK